MGRPARFGLAWPMRSAGPGADWRDADAYAPLLAADRIIFAWEWLRRNPGYRAAAGIAPSQRNWLDPAAWGLHRFEDPHAAAPAARPLWRADHYPSVVVARAVPPAEPADAIDLNCFPGIATMARGTCGREFWLLSDGLHTIRLDLAEGSAAGGPVELHFQLFGRAALNGPLLALRRLLALAQTGCFAKSLHPAEQGARRWILALRAHDALVAGACQREIAAALISGSAGETRWRIQTPSVRSQAQRLVRAARALAGGGYRTFLR